MCPKELNIYICMRETGFLFLLLQTAEGARDKYLRIASSIAAAAAANDVLAKKTPPPLLLVFLCCGDGGGEIFIDRFPFNSMRA